MVIKINLDTNPLVSGSPAKPSIKIVKHILKNLFSIKSPERLSIEKLEVSSPLIAENIKKCEEECNAYVEKIKKEESETIELLTEQISKISRENEKLKFQISQPNENDNKVKRLTPIGRLWPNSVIE